MRLHSGSQGGHGQGDAGAPGFIGWKLLKRGFGGFSKTFAIFFERRLMVCEERLNSLQATASGACSEFYVFHRTERDRRSVFP